MEDNENLRLKYEQKRQEVKRITELLYGSSNEGALPGGTNYSEGVVHPDLVASGGYSTGQNIIR